MKTVQKLEIAAGFATFVTTFAYFCAYFLPYAKFEYENYGSADFATALLKGFLILLIPAVLTAIGAYFWAARSSRLGYVAAIFGGSIITLFFGTTLFTGAAFYFHGFVMGLILSAPLAFAILTLVLAFWCRRLFLLTVRKGALP
ncbi:MAG: hypothetical protein IT173_14870 [Acidobacteria bacterium]|nr:hypothetical protein [Acidobacteriota bacterium]